LEVVAFRPVLVNTGTAGYTTAAMPTLTVVTANLPWRYIPGENW